MERDGEMLNRQTLSKIRCEMKGLDSWPMSSSYPQESGEREFKELMRSLKTRAKEEKEVGHHKGTFIDSCSNTIWKTLCGLQDENSDIDQVDGGSEDILKPLVTRHEFLLIHVLFPLVFCHFVC